MDSNPKVLILCNDFPPINSIGADRPNSWYLYFKEFGLDPVGVTKNWNSNGNTSFNDVSHSLEVESTKYGELIKTPGRKTLPLFSTQSSFYPSIIVQKMYPTIQQPYLYLGGKLLQAVL